MSSTIQNICTITDGELKNYGYDPKRLGYSEEEIRLMKNFIKYAKRTNLHIEHFEHTGDNFVETDKDGVDWVLR